MTDKNQENMFSEPMKTSHLRLDTFGGLSATKRGTFPNHKLIQWIAYSPSIQVAIWGVNLQLIHKQPSLFLFFGIRG